MINHLRQWLVSAGALRASILALALFCVGLAMTELAGKGAPWWLLFALGFSAAAFGATLSGPRAVPRWTPAPAAEPQPLHNLAPLLEALPEPALVVDREGRIAGSNAAVRRQLQFEASGLRLSAILRHPDVLDGAQAAAVDGLGRSVDYQPAGLVEEHFRVHVSPIAWSGAQAALLVFHDQTTTIATERMRADFLANASHELRTPIASLSLLIETLTGPAREDFEAQARFLPMMASQVERMRRLVDDLLSLSRIELDEHVPPQGEAPLGRCVREAVDAAQLLARQQDVRLHCTQCDLPAIITADRFQLQQVLQNLIDNAIKFAPSGAGTVSVEVGVADSREAALAEGGRRWEASARISLLTPPPGPERKFVFVRVADNGRGIPRRHLPRLSERFYRVDPDARTERRGTGLGLAICKHIMARHRGGFCVESILGEGTAFTVYFPLLRIENDERSAQDAGQVCAPGMLDEGFHKSDA